MSKIDGQARFGGFKTKDKDMQSGITDYVETKYFG